MAIGYPIICDKDFIKLGVLDDFSSFIWTTRYYSAGDFELTIGVSERAMEWLKIGNYVMQSADNINIGIIESLEADISEEQSYMIIARGRFLPALLGRRIIAQQTQLTGLLSAGIYSLINDAIIDPVILARKIENFIIDQSYEGIEKIDVQFTGDNLLDAISTICEEKELGFNVKYEEGQFVFWLYKGIDRSYAQNVNPRVIFSDKYDNLLSSQLLEDASYRITDALVAGEGEGLERRTVWVTNSEQPTGIDRFEGYLDSRNIRSADGTVSDRDYIKALQQEGFEALTDYTAAFSGEVSFINTVYGRDVFMGDICTVENSKLGKYVNARLVEVIESVNETGNYVILPTFGL